MDWHTLFAFTPILFVIVLLFVFKRPLTFSGPLTYIYTLIIAMLIWQMDTVYAFAASLRGVLIAIDITIIIFGAIFFLEVLKESKVIDSLEVYLSKISPDRRIQAIIIAWFLVSFIEGTAGFGTPAAIAAPLLVAIGFPAVTAVAIALIGDSAAVVFGAVGTPIRIGFAGLETSGVAFYAGLINLFLGVLVPVMILIVLVRSVKERYPGAIKEALPFAVWSGVCLAVPYFLLTFLGQEFPALVAPLIGLPIVIFTTRKKWFVPKRTLRFGKGSLHHSETSHIFSAILPYAMLILLLIVGKYVLQSYKVQLLGVLPHSVNTYNPGFAFILAILFFALVQKGAAKYLKTSFSVAMKILFKPFIAILFITAFVQLMIHSGNNISGLGSMTNLIANVANTRALPFLAPFIGMFGAFIAGSATVSNILFGSFHATIASNLQLNLAVVLALQVVGAGIGNMIALTNIVAAQATVHLHGKEIEIIKKNIVPALVYAVLAGIFGLLLVYLV